MKKIILIFIILLIFTIPVHSYTTSQHNSVAIKLAEHAENNTQALMLGFFSHAVLDTIRPQMYRFDIFHPQGNYDIVMLELGLSIYQIWRYRNNEKKIYAIIGSLAPDVIEGVFVLHNKKRWYRGNHVFPWHSNTTNNRLEKPTTMIISLTLFSFDF